MKLLMVSDTHIGDRPDAVLPPEMEIGFEQADVVIHAGDWTSLEILDVFESRSRRMIGVLGNNDAGLAGRLPEVNEVELGGLFFSVVHIAGPLIELDDRFPDADVVVFGHSHRAHDSVSAKGKRLLNPGSPINYERWSGGSTLMTAVVEHGRIQVWTHRLRKADRPIELWPS